MKRWIALSLMMALTISMVGCGKSATSRLKKDTNPNKGLVVIGENIKYDPNKLINNGDPIQVEFWVWDASKPLEELEESYEKIYPNVDIKIVTHPWQDYWTKLPLALKGKNGPAIFNVHNSQHDNIIHYMAPYDIPVDELKKDFINVDSHLIDGQVYYIDYGMMTGAIYYNRQLWAEAGLAEADIPKTWEQFTQVAKKLTKTDSNGNIVQSGFNFNEDYNAMLMGLNYQYGENLFKEDGKIVNIDNSTTEKTTKFLYDLYNVEKVGSKDFGLKSSESFGQGQTAMVYKWGWFNDYLPKNYPDIDFGVFRIPTPTSDIPYAYDRYNGESTFGVNKNADKAQQEVAQDFIRFFMASDESIKSFCISLGVFPAKKSLAEDRDILNHKLLSTLAPSIERYIWPGPFPNTIENTLMTIYQDIFYNDKPIKEAVGNAQKIIEKDMSNVQFQSVENQYKFYSEKK